MVWITPDDCAVIAQYEKAPLGSWGTMPEEDKAIYLRLHQGIQEILRDTLATIDKQANLAGCTTLGFNPTNGVRGNRPKDLWCAIYPEGSEVHMPQVYLIVSHRGVELGYSAAIHRSDFSDQKFKEKLKQVIPVIFASLPDPTSGAVAALSLDLERTGGWRFRNKTRLSPDGADHADLPSMISFLKTPEGQKWGAGTIARYWTPDQLSAPIDFKAEFERAARLFRPLLVRPAVQGAMKASHSSTTDAPTDEVGTISDLIGKFLDVYAVKRSSQSFGTDKQLWGILDAMRRAINALPSMQERETMQVSWSVGKGNWAKVPWMALLDTTITESTESGTFGVFLFREDLSGVYLTYGQGATRPKREHGAVAGLQLLAENAKALRANCEALFERGFSFDNEIDLRTDGGLGRDYEAGTIAYKLYERGKLPDDEEIAQDLEALLSVYARDQIPNRDLDTKLRQEGRPIPEAVPYSTQDALADLFLEEPELNDLMVLWKAKKNLVLQGPPGVGKTFLAKRLAFLLMGHRDSARLRAVQFHQSYSYEDFVQGYRPTESGGFVLRDGVFFDFAKLAEADSERTYVFIIDEINRGNLSKILGELLMLVETDKRGKEFAIPLTYSKPGDLPFSVPPNLYFIGLMNTADRSLAMVDYALRRRFAFYDMEPCFYRAKFQQTLVDRGVSVSLVAKIVTRMTKLNDVISADTARLGPGYRIGHSYFTPAERSQIWDDSWFRRVVKSEVGPLLREYWFDDIERAAELMAELEAPLIDQ